MTWRKGDHRVICDRCGFKRWSSETAMEWTGMRVCKIECYETRHPQDFVRAKADNQSVPNPRPEATDSFLSVGDVTVDDL